MFVSRVRGKQRGGFNEQGKLRGIDMTQQSDSYLEA